MHTHSRGDLSDRTARPRDSAPPYRPLILLAEDDDDFRNLLVLALEEDGYRVRSVSTGMALRAALHGVLDGFEPPALIVTDHRMPRGSGLEVLLDVRMRGWNVQMVLITAFGDEETVMKAELAGATVMRKPFDLDDFRTLTGYLVPRYGADSRVSCASCGGVDDLRWVEDARDVFFCRECRDVAEDNERDDPFVDLGGGD